VDKCAKNSLIGSSDGNGVAAVCLDAAHADVSSTAIAASPSRRISAAA